MFGVGNNVPAEVVPALPASFARTSLLYSLSDVAPANVHGSRAVKQNIYSLPTFPTSKYTFNVLVVSCPHFAAMEYQRHDSHLPSQIHSTRVRIHDLELSIHPSDVIVSNV